jgi:hypothetical protein
MSGKQRRHTIDAPHTRRAFLRYGGSMGLAAASLREDQPAHPLHRSH